METMTKIDSDSYLLLAVFALGAALPLGGMAIFGELREGQSIHGGVLWRFGDFVAQPHVDVGRDPGCNMIHN